MTNERTTQTTYGPARFHVSADGLLSLMWQNVTINRVQYKSARVYQYRNRYTDSVYTEQSTTREDGKEPSSAALAAFRVELVRLVPLLVTPQAIARARAEETGQELARREKATQEAQEAEARARAEYAAACAALALFEPLKAERLDELEDGAA